MAFEHKRTHQSRDNRRDRFVPHGRKRRRLSGDREAVQSIAPATEEGTLREADEGWTVVNYTKNSGRRHSSVKHSSSGHVDNSPRSSLGGSRLPQIRYHRNYKSDVSIHDLQVLLLYALADGVAPSWCAVSDKNQIRKAVVLMVPGLDNWALARAREILKTKHDAGDDKTAKPASDKDIQARRDIEQNVSMSSWLLDNQIEVKAPGDSKMARVHSPLQAMLLCAEQDKNKRGVQEKGFEATPTPITDFIHTSDELRDAEFPIHPAAFTVKADADLELSRRSQTGQSSSDGWQDTRVTTSRPHIHSSPSDWLSQDLTPYAVDCEMVQTSDDNLSLARVSVVDQQNKTIFDSYVKPTLPITDYFTQYSGITPEHLANVTTTLADVQSQLLDLFTPETILLGHSLESDLNALKMTHPFIVDTALLYPHSRGLPLRNALKFLANKYLKRDIQTAGAKGHDSVEDARAVMDLVKLKCEKGLKWGTLEANGEPIFRRLKGAGRTSAMVEYGTPERGLGKDATYHIGCQSDEEVVAGIVRAAQGDTKPEHAIPEGGADFVWGRLRALELARGWVSSPIAKAPVKDSRNDNSVTAASGSVEKADVENVDEVILRTISGISKIRDSLPPQTLLTVFSGTSDVRPVLKLQAVLQQYRREFKSKKWDELSVQWTDHHEQELRRACHEARRGWAVAAVV